MKETLGGVGFFTGAAMSLDGADVFCVTALGVEPVAADVLPVVVDATVTGVELTKTGSEDGMGFPSLVCNFTTF